MNTHTKRSSTLSPVVASIILIAVVVAVSIAVAALMGVLVFTPATLPIVIVPIPQYQNATYAHAWVDGYADTNSPQQLPFNLTIETTKTHFTLKVVYYNLVRISRLNSTMTYMFLQASNEIQYLVDLTEYALPYD